MEQHPEGGVACLGSWLAGFQRLVGLVIRASVPNVTRGQALETAYGHAQGIKLWRANPMSGSGMKKDRQAQGGARRQEVLKNLEAQGGQVRQAWPQARCPEWEYAVGDWTSREVP